MDVIRFQTVVNGEQIIRPPADVVLPDGPLEITVRPIESAVPKPTRESANARLRQCRVSTGQANGIDNEQIDADLARSIGEALD